MSSEKETKEAPEEERPETAAPTEEAPETSAPAEDAPEAAEKTPAKESEKAGGLSRTAKIVLLVAILAVIAGVIVGLLLWQNHGASEPEETTAPTEEPTDSSEATNAFEDKTLAQGESITTAYGNAAYLLDPEGFGSGDATANACYSTSTAAPGDVQMMTAVARDVNGDYCLTNAELQIYYWMEFYQLMNSYGSYVTMLGLDYTQPLSQQTAPTGATWEQYFLEQATRNFSEFRALYRQAQEEGYSLPDDLAAQVADVLEPDGDFAAEAASAGYESPDAYLQKNFGNGVDVNAYHNYLLVYFTAMSYYSDVLYAQSEDAITEESAEAYFDEHTEDYANQGLEKVNNVSVRHILIVPEGEKDENDAYSDEALAAAKEEAERIYALWQENPTEEYFIELAGEYNEDPGSTASNGLYEDFQPGSTTEAFNDWCFDQSRETGDCEIVETPFGYHIIYFVERTETRAWLDAAIEDMAIADCQEKITKITEAKPVEFNFGNVVLFDLTTAVLAES